MKDKGFAGIGCMNMKTAVNYGTLFRTAQIFEIDFIFVIGCKFKPQASDTMKSWRHMPAYSFTDFKDFNEHRPYDCELIGIEITDESIPIYRFSHPKNACYLLGAEDNGLTKEAINSCQKIIQIPGSRSLNVSVAGSIVLYDRILKANGNR